MTGYNFRIKEYPTGEIQLVYYHKPMSRSEGCNEYEYELNYDIKALSDELYHIERRADVVPFLDDNGHTIFCDELTDLDDCKESEPDELDSEDIVRLKKERSVRSSRNRAIAKIYDYARSNTWDYFVTLTFDQAKVDRFDYSACVKAAGKYFNNMRDRYAPDIKYLMVAEEHLNGEVDANGNYAWHMHALVSNIGNIPLVRAINNARKWEIKPGVFIDNKYYGDELSTAHGDPIYNLGNFRYGNSTCTKVRNSYKCAMYITKYITKSLIRRVPNKRKYFNSLNLDLPFVYTQFVDVAESGDLSDVFRNFEDLYNKEVTLIKNVSVTNGCFENTVSYIELK